MLNLEPREQGHIVAVTFDASAHVRHDVQHELTRLLVDIIGIDQNLADVRVEVVTNCPNHQA